MANNEENKKIIFKKLINKLKKNLKNQGQQIYERTYEHCILHFSEFLMQFHKNINF